MPSSETKTADEQSKSLKTLPAVLKELETVLAKLSPHQKKLASLEETWEKNTLLEQELSGLKREYDTLKTGLAGTVVQLEDHRKDSENARKVAKESQDKLEKKLKEANERSHNLEMELKELRRNSVNKDEIKIAAKSEGAKHEKELRHTKERFSKEANGLKGEVMNLNQALDSTNRYLKGTEVELENYREELRKARKDLCVETFDKKLFLEKMDILADNCHTLAIKYFSTVLVENPQKCYADLRGALNRSGLMKSTAPFEIPLSNSPVSRFMRAAVAEHTIASNISRNVFRQFNFQDQSTSEVLESILKGLFKLDIRQEAVCRAVLNVACQTQSDTAVVQRRLVSSTTTAVIEELRPLLETSNDGHLNLQTFRSVLEELVRSALDTWEPTFRSNERICAIMNSQIYDQWESWKDYDECVELTESQRLLRPFNGQMSLVLFPMMYQPSNAEALNSGLAVKSNDPLATAAFLEANEIARSLIGRSEDTGGNRGGGRPNRRGSMKQNSPLLNNSSTQKVPVAENGMAFEKDTIQERSVIS